jgi:hypothetical protein
MAYYLLLQSDTKFVREFCSANFMKPKLSKIRVIFLPRKWAFYTIRADLEFLLYCEQIVLRIWVYILIANLIFINMLILYKIWGFHGGDYEEDLECGAM